MTQEKIVKGLTFEQWKAKVNVLVVDRCYLTCDDLPDWGYWDAWNDGMTPSSAANKVIRNAKDY